MSETPQNDLLKGRLSLHYYLSDLPPHPDFSQVLGALQRWQAQAPPFGIPHEKWVEVATDLYADDDINVDQEAILSEVEGEFDSDSASETDSGAGCWVQAWVWVAADTVRSAMDSPADSVAD